MKSDISDFQAFKGALDRNKLYDLETPYGYGGPLASGPVSAEDMKLFGKELKEYCRDTGIVSQFVRFHPLLGNHTVLDGPIEIRYMRDTIYMNTGSPELIMSNMDSKNRNMVRKAQKNGVTVVRKEVSEYKEFKDLYEETMTRDNADPYFFFKEDYYDFHKEMKDNACIFYAVKDGEYIAGAIVYYNSRFAHYHLAGTRTGYRQFAPSNLMLYEIACWAGSVGIEKFHLGGGMAPDDSLFGFKKQFNKNGRLPFYVGRTIFDNAVYKELMDLRKKLDEGFNLDNNRMIGYRCM